jgi:hypothetical protein
MSMLRRSVTVVFATALGVACDDSTSPSGQDVTVRFAVAGATTNALVANGAASQVGASSLAVTGTNGTLQIDRIAFIVTRVEFEQSDDACELDHRGGHDDSPGADDNPDDDCDEFRFAPSFVDLALPGGAVTVETDGIPEGTWTRVKFRVKNLDFDDDDDNANDDDDDENLEDTALNAVLAVARAAFPDWPRKASLVVSGSFLPTGATTAIPFTTYFDGEIKVKMPLQPPLEVTAAGASREVTIELDPDRWFKNGDGSVVNLSSFDFDATHQLVEFRLKMREGFVQVRMDD